MGWAAQYIQKLEAGETVQFRPRGQSMAGKIESGQLVTVEPLTDSVVLKKGDVVLCKVKGAEYLHLISSAPGGGKQLQISNNHGFVNGWIGRGCIYGICTKIEP
jgi:hypothetical protein